MKRMLGNAAPAAKGKGKKKAEVDDNDDAEPLKLVYVTPERIEKSKTFVNTLQKCYDAGLLSRFVIDEAHCLSSMGHDYRPGYLSLQRLRVLFPKVGPRLAAPSLSRLTPPLSQVPILAVTATAPQNVVADMLKILGLSPRISPGHAALPQTTVLFSAPLYRPNLRYSVVPKPANAQVALEAMIDWVLEYHPGESGILYTLSRAECEKISQAINGHPRTKGKMRAAVCASSRQKVTLLADVLTTKARRPRLHRRRREAARARSLALGPHHHGRRDERLVRTWHRQGRRALRPAWFVTQEPRQSLPGEREGGEGRSPRRLHHVLPRCRRVKALDTDVRHLLERWQGEACVSSPSSSQTGPQLTRCLETVYEVIRFAEDKKTCRKVLFARYFESTYDAGTTFDASDEDGDAPCGHCDNVRCSCLPLPRLELKKTRSFRAQCLRDPSTVSTRNVSLAAYRALRIIVAATAQRGTLTLPQAADLVRGNGGGTFSTQETKGKGKGRVDVKKEGGAKVDLTKDETEQMLLMLLVEGWLQEDFHASAPFSLAPPRVFSALER